ncbi:TM2 domain-containing protein [Candidatus Stoquefichus massiliensis]|uniref:TM2 domain-containing protein n=1 Tax=Candidatus Stoquefichus massiliensis TaxID=1470350 RepID=UPI000488E793|nr:TM2 domain-containing protein [Candidatus Stoquefichus massiliensis]
MYCQNCGKELNETDQFCGSCGAKVIQLRRNCPNCGASIESFDQVCSHCGYQLPVEVKHPIIQKSRVVAGLLGIFLGGMGVHNFYLGYSSKGFIQVCLFLAGILTLGLTSFAAALWGFVEGILLLCGSIERDGNDHLLK